MSLIKAPRVPYVGHSAHGFPDSVSRLPLFAKLFAINLLQLFRAGSQRACRPRGRGAERLRYCRSAACFFQRYARHGDRARFLQATPSGYSRPNPQLRSPIGSNMRSSSTAYLTAYQSITAISSSPPVIP